MPPPGQTPCCWSAACHGGIRNIYKLKATSCGLFCIRKPCPRIHVRSGMQFPLTAPLGNCIPLRLQIPGRIFHQSPQPETASHSKGKFRDTLSETPSIRKARPTLRCCGVFFTPAPCAEFDSPRYGGSVDAGFGQLKFNKHRIRFESRLCAENPRICFANPHRLRPPAGILARGLKTLTRFLYARALRTVTLYAV